MDGVYLLTAYAAGNDQDGPKFIKSNDEVLCTTWVCETSFFSYWTCLPSLKKLAACHF